MQYQDWIGRTEETNDLLSPAPLRGMAALLDLDATPTELPPLWHWLYFLPSYPQRTLDADGHVARGGFLPPVALPRRMWAGGRVQWLAPLRQGDAITRKSTVQSVEQKSGRSGELVFVTVMHEISNAQGVAIIEEHDLVYRGLATGSPAGTTPTQHAQWQREIRPEPTLLFRYSALTFNTHRIHYDQPYVTKVEGYPGLVVHGPLIATLLVEAMPAALRARMTQFSFRALRPLFDTATFQVAGRADGPDVSLWATDSTGMLCMQASATLA